jgi:hypothetical protein
VAKSSERWTRDTPFGPIIHPKETYFAPLLVEGESVLIANRSITTDLRGTASTVKNRAPTPTRPVHCQSVGEPTPLRLVRRQQLGASTPPRLVIQRPRPSTNATPPFQTPERVVTPGTRTAPKARACPPTPQRLSEMPPQPQPEHPSSSRLTTSQP